MPSIAGPFLALSLFLATASAAIPSLSGYNVVWSDDFNGAQGVGVDSSKWVQKVGPTGANGELEVYTSGTGNVHLSGDGQLYIIPTLSGGTNAAWSAPTGGAMIVQSELWVPDFAGSPAKFGGLWPAFWTKGNNYRSSGVPWPRCGEWDIFEARSISRTRAERTTARFNKRVAYATGQYHTWAFKVDLRNSDWTKQALTWYLDGVEFYKVTGAMIGTFEQWVQLAWNDYYIILNVAVGGDYPGYPTSQTVSGYDSSMRVRYVAVYKTV
ncbi:glycoside hydrolase family 16 protein [Mycena olivaceomarginata]|nr:glycoside hydrolase family 16 protein [Mycena olivaceomarginata]